MKFNQKAFSETKDVTELLEKIDSIDNKYVEQISDEIYQRQPFFMSVLLGYRHDLSTQEFSEFMKIHFMVWEFFRFDKKVQTKKVTEKMFEPIVLWHVNMLKYANNEPNKEVIEQIYSNDMLNVKALALLTAIFTRCYTRPTLINMDSNNKAMALIGVKSFIECFENL